MKSVLLALLTMILSTTVHARDMDCGNTVGTIDARIADCANVAEATKTSSSGVVWQLVSRKTDQNSQYKDQFEVWRDSKTGALWGDRLAKQYSHFDAVALKDIGCKDDIPNTAYNCEVSDETACHSAEATVANAGITEKTFGLPSVEEFLQANQDGFLEVTTHNYSAWYWTMSLSYYNPTDSAKIINGQSGHSDTFVRVAHDNDVRCIAR